MSEEKEVSGVKGVLIKLGLAGAEKSETFGPGPDARPTPVAPTPRAASPDALAKLKADIGFDDPASPYRVFEGILQTLEDAIPDVPLRYKKALQLAERQAASSDAIVQSFEELKTRLMQQSDILTATIDDLTRKRVAPRKGVRAELEATLAKLRAEVAEREAEIAEVDNIIRSEEASLLGMSENFSAARDNVVLELRSMERAFYENLGIKE